MEECQTDFKEHPNRDDHERDVGASTDSKRSRSPTKKQTRKRAKVVTAAPTDAEVSAAKAFYEFKASLLPEGKKKRRRRTKEQQLATRTEYTADRVEALRFTQWVDSKTLYHTSVNKIDVYTYSFADATTASALAAACADAGNSHKTQRENKAAMKAELAPKRATDCAKNGDNCAMERRVLVSVRASAHRLRFLILPDGCLADALYRTDDMPPGQWLLYQQKTTFEMATTPQPNRNTYRSGWQFRSIKGYGKMLVACECETDGKIWVLEGTTLDVGQSTDLWITFSQKEKVLPPQCDASCLPTDRKGLVDRMLTECAKVTAHDPTALRTATIYEAEAELGPRHRVERAGILAHLEHDLGGATPVTNDSLVIRQTRSGAVFWYPEEPNGKTDLYVQRLGQEPERRQYKTCHKLSNKTGWYVGLSTADGTDANGRSIKSNTYKPGDNDYYVIVLPATEATSAIPGETHFWVIPDAVMAEHNLVGDAPLSGFLVHMRDNLQETRGGVANKTKYAWTKEFHQGFAASGVKL
jgi:hypothetical protein